MIDSTIGCCIPLHIMYTTTYYDSKVKYNGYTYEHLVYAMGTCLVREDAGKVYVIGATDSTERVLYDFNLGLHDTLRTVYPQDTYIAWVSQLDSTELYGTWYKVWHFNGVDSNADSLRPIVYNVIEGIGCTNGPYYPASPYSVALFSDQLLCFTNDMGFTTPFSNPVISYGNNYTNPFDNYISCASFRTAPVVPPDTTTYLSTQHLFQNSNNVSVVPDPVNEHSRIMFPYAIQSGTLIILNELGQVVINVSFRNKDEVLIGDNIHVPGVYFYRVTDNQNGKGFSGKFVNR